jgi:hypothetical protein
MAKTFKQPAESESDDVAAIAVLTDQLVTKLNGLKARRAALIVEARALPDEIKPHEPRAAMPSLREQRVAEILGREPVLSQTPTSLSANERLFMINVELQAIDEAMEVLRSQYQTERLARSRAACAKLRPENARHVAAISRALIALRELQSEYLAFTDGLIKQNVALIGLDVRHPEFAGHPRDKCSRVAYYLRDSVQLGFIPANEVPAELRGRA